MFLGIILSIFCLQGFTYWIIDNRNLPINKLWVILLILLFYLIIFPYIFFQLEFRNDGPKCGLPVMGMIGAFWLFGGGTTIITHISYYLLKKALKNG
jgi:hypothetical protein